MRMKKMVALLLSLAMLCGMLSSMTLAPVSAAATLTNGYSKAVNSWLLGIDTWNAFRSENYIVCYEYGYDAKDSWYKDYYTGPNRTATNPWGYEVAVNKYGYVIAVEDGIGNMEIPEGGYVLSGNTKGATTLRDAVNNGVLKIGDRLVVRTKGSSQYYVMRVTEDDKLLGDNVTMEVPYTDLVGAYATTVTIGGNGATTAKSEWQNYLLCKQTGTTDAGLPTGYSVKMINARTEIPAGYFVVTLPGQTGHDTGVASYNAAYFLKEYASAGATVTCGTNELFFRYDVAAAVRAAQLMTGTDGMAYDFSASTIYNDALNNFELVNTDRMGVLYNNMVAITKEIKDTMTVDAIRPYLATLYQNYRELAKLEYEVRTVEMRAAWMRPLPNDRKERSAAELDKLLTDNILEIKEMGYNMIFVEAFYNSTTVFPIPEGVGYQNADGTYLSFKQNPYLVPKKDGGLNGNLTDRYDMLARFIEICEENGMEPHIWWEVFYVGYERTNGATDALFDYSVAKTIMNNTTTYKNWLNKGSNGDLFYGAATDGALQYFLNPANTGVRTFLMNTFKYVWSTYDVSSFQLDYIRYPHTNAQKCFGYDSDTLAAFKQSKYYKPAVHTDSYLKTYEGFYDADWVQFRADFVTSFVKEVKDTMKEIAPDVYLTSSPGPEPSDSKKNLMQDVSYWLQNDYIDIIFPMAYGENVPGLVSAGLVADNNEHFVCTGVSGSYLNADMEARWMKEVRDAGADGLAAFGNIASYADYVWSKPAITPTGNAAKAGRKYIADTVDARIDQMVKLSGITAAQATELKAATAALDSVIRFNGMTASATLTAINELQAVVDTLSAKADAALTKDVNYLIKIRNNSRDEADEIRETVGDSFTVNDGLLKNDGDAFTYVGATDTLYITENNAVLSGELTPAVTVVLAEGVDEVVFDGVVMNGAVTIESADAFKVKLVGINNVNGDVAALGKITYVGYGEISAADNLVMRKADVTEDGAINSGDVRHMLQYTVRSAELSDYQVAAGDIDGNGKLNTIDTRKVLAFTLGLAA